MDLELGGAWVDLQTCFRILCGLISASIGVHLFLRARAHVMGTWLQREEPTEPEVPARVVVSRPWPFAIRIEPDMAPPEPQRQSECAKCGDMLRRFWQPSADASGPARARVVCIKCMREGRSQRGVVAQTQAAP